MACDKKGGLNCALKVELLRVGLCFEMPPEPFASEDGLFTSKLCAKLMKIIGLCRKSFFSQDLRFLDSMRLSRDSASSATFSEDKTNVVH